jgi:lipoprotein-releasing system permease protein
MAVSRRFEVLGTFEAGFFEYDTGWALVSLETAQRLFGEPGAVSTIQVQVERVGRVDDVAARISPLLPEELGLTTWKEMNRPLFSAFKLEKLMMFLTIGLIVVVAALGIVITLVMSVMEKTKDIGLLRALGATSASVKWIFLIQGAAVGIVGTVLGCALGLAAAWWLDRFQVIRLDPQVYFIPYVPFRVKPLEFTAIASVAVVVCFLATLYPARQAARLDPVEALRSE